MVIAHHPARDRGASPRLGRSREERAFMRLPVRLETTICSSAVRRISADLVDISITGGRLATPNYLPAGCHLTLTIPTLAPLGATVRWCGDMELGLEFARALHPLVVDRVVRLGREPRD